MMGARFHVYLSIDGEPREGELSKVADVTELVEALASTLEEHAAGDDVHPGDPLVYVTLRVQSIHNTHAIHRFRQQWLLSCWVTDEAAVRAAMEDAWPRT